MPRMGIVSNVLAPVPARRVVTARLVAPVGWHTTPAGGVRETTTTWVTQIADDGSWSLDLPASASFDADDTWFQITEPGARHAVVMPAGAGPFQLRDVAVVDPSAPACCPPPPAGSVADGARSLEELLDVEGTESAQSGDVLVKSSAGEPWRPGRPAPDALRELTHVVSAPALEWLHVHGLGRYPASVQAIRSDNRLAHAAIDFPDLNTVRARWGQPTSGRLTLAIVGA